MGFVIGAFCDSRRRWRRNALAGKLRAQRECGRKSVCMLHEADVISGGYGLRTVDDGGRHYILFLLPSDGFLDLCGFGGHGYIFCRI